MKGKGGELNGFLDRGSSFKGELEFEDTMRIDGRFSGKIVSKNELVVGESAHIEGDVHVGRATGDTRIPPRTPASVPHRSGPG